MAYTPPTNEPSELRAGDTWAWRREDLSDYPASTWTLTYYFRNSSAKFDIAASADGDAFAVSVAKASTGKTPGWYDWIALVDDGTSRHEVDSGRIEILPNLATDVVYDARSFARKMLDYIEAELVSRGSSGQLDLLNATLEGRGIQRDRAGLVVLRSQFLREVAAEDNASRIANGLGSKRRLVVRFGA